MKTSFALLASLLTLAPPVRAEPPSGKFVVVAARRDPAVTNPQALYRQDDPQLVNRIVTISPTLISYDDGGISCANASMKTSPSTTGALFRTLFGERQKPGYPRYARPADFGVPLAPASPVPVTRFRCPMPDQKHGAEWNRAAMFPIGQGRWGLWLVEDFLLMLKPVSGRPVASFDCGKPGLSTTERAICADPVLAGWDRSVAAAYKDSQASVDDQRAWLAERNTCGSGRHCLREKMDLRVSNLLQ